MLLTRTFATITADKSIALCKRTVREPALALASFFLSLYRGPHHETKHKKQNPVPENATGKIIPGQARMSRLQSSPNVALSPFHRQKKCRETHWETLS